MKFMIPFLMAMLPLASVAESQSGGASGVPSVAIPKTTEVLVIQTPKQGVTFQQVMAVIPAEIRATVGLYLDGRIREWYSRGDGKGDTPHAAPRRKSFLPRPRIAGGCDPGH
jgi:hypothetical protein